MNTKHSDKILAVVCHDAGSANIIFSWLESALELNPDTANLIKIFALGPSKKLLDSFGQQDPLKIQLISTRVLIMRALKNLNLVITFLMLITL